MAKSFLKPDVVMTRREKKILHCKHASAVIPKGRRKYQSTAFKCKELIKSIHTDNRPVDWTAVTDKPELFSPGDGIVYGLSGCVSNPRRPGKTTAMRVALGDQAK